MKESQFNRRKFIKEAASTAAGIIVLSSFPKETLAIPGQLAGGPVATSEGKSATFTKAPRIKFSIIGINHAHINGQVEAVTRGGGQFVSFYAKEPDLAAAFSKRFPQAKQVNSEKEILE